MSDLVGSCAVLELLLCSCKTRSSSSSSSSPRRLKTDALLVVRTETDNGLFFNDQFVAVLFVTGPFVCLRLAHGQHSVFGRRRRRRRCRRHRPIIGGGRLAWLDQPAAQRTAHHPTTCLAAAAAAAAARSPDTSSSSRGRAEARHLQADAADLVGGHLGFFEELKGAGSERVRVASCALEVEKLGASVANPVPQVLPREAHALLDESGGHMPLPHGIFVLNLLKTNTSAVKQNVHVSCDEFDRIDEWFLILSFATCVTHRLLVLR